MSWLFSQALVAAYSEATCSDGEQCALSNAAPMPQAFCAPDKMTDFSSISRFGMTFAPLTDGHGKALLTWFLAGFPVRISAPPEREKELPESAAGCGKSLPGLFAKYDHVSCSWKTRQFSLLGGLMSFLGTWPRWGSMRNGECSERQPWERRTKETAFGLWPTPNVPNGGRRVPNNAEIKGGNTPTAYLHGKKMQVGLEQAVKWWPTPTKSDGCGGPGCSGGLGGMNLRTAVTYPTPLARDFKSGKASKKTMEKNSRPLSEQIGGQLNPTWIEWLMGWPLGWTELEPLATDKFHTARPWPGRF